MNRGIHWSKRAEKSYGKIIDYVAEEFGKARARRYVATVYAEVNKLGTNPGIGQGEPLLEGARYDFRRLVVEDLTKIIYRVTDDSIEIADVWDTRQDPTELVERMNN